MYEQPFYAQIRYLPTELWIIVFEQLSDCARDVHIFKQFAEDRLNNIRQLQKLQYVCRAWRDMIRPLTYRHIAVTGLESWSISEHNLRSFKSFIESWDLNNNVRGRKNCWIETLILRHDRNSWSVNDGRFIGLLRNLLPHLTYLTEFACYTVLSATDFELLVTASHGTLRKLRVRLDRPDLPAVFFSLPRFRAIEDLSITCHPSNSVNFFIPEIPDEALDLPNLRHLELFSTSLGVENFLLWFLRLPPSNLKVFKVRVFDRAITRELLPFMTKHGTNLDTLSIVGAGFRFGSVDLLALTPELKHLGLFANYESIAMFLAKPPAPVEDLTLFTYLTRLQTPWRLMADLLMWLEQLPRPNLLRIVRISLGTFADVPARPASWKSMLENMRGTEEQLRKVVEQMAQLQGLGIRMLDEEGLALKDYILEQLETRFANDTNGILAEDGLKIDE